VKAITSGLLLFGLTTLAACGSLSGGKAATISTDPGRPQVSFQSVVLGTTGKRIIQIQNVGDLDLHVTKITIVPDKGTADTVFTLDNPPGQLTLTGRGSEGSTFPLTVNYTPPDPHSKSAMLIIESNDPLPDNNPYMLRLVSPELVPQISFDPPAGLDFGAVQVGTMSTMCRPLGGGDPITPRCMLNVMNTGFIDLEINGTCWADDGVTFTFEWADGEGPTKCDGSKKIVLKPGEAREVNVTYAGEGTLSSTSLRFTSNDPNQSDAKVKVVAQDHPVCIAVVVDGMTQTVTPGVNPQVNFGVIDPGNTITKTVKVCNCEPAGGFDLNLETAGFTSTSDPQFTISSPPMLPAMLHPQMEDASCISFDVTYAPTSTSSAGATVEVVQDTGAKTDIDIFARPCGNPPVAVARANGRTGDVVVVPLSTVNLSATDSRDGMGQTVGLTYKWQFDRAPGASLTSGSAFSFNMDQPVQRCMAGQTTMDVACFFVDQAGVYEAKLTVTDSQGCSSVDTLTLRANPANAIHVEMTWAVDADIDLHMTQPGGVFGCFDGMGGSSAESDSDCAYCNCRGVDMNGDGVPDLSPTLDWGPVLGMGDGNPNTNPGLDIDRICLGSDVASFVPENIVLGTQDFPPFNGKYHVAAHYFGNCSGAGAVDVTVRILIQGVERYTQTRTLMAPGNVWHVARIDWMDGAATVCDIDRFFTQSPMTLPVHPADDSADICN
jgi:hypothetical protein